MRTGEPGTSPVQQPRAVWRETRPPPAFYDQTGVTAERGHHVHTAAPAVGSEDDRAAIRREARLAIVSRIACEADGLTAVDALKPEVELAFADAIGRINNERAVGRQRRFGGIAGIPCNRTKGRAQIAALTRRGIETRAQDEGESGNAQGRERSDRDIDRSRALFPDRTCRRLITGLEIGPRIGDVAQAPAVVLLKESRQQSLDRSRRVRR